MLHKHCQNKGKIAGGQLDQRSNIHVRQKGRWGPFVATPVEQGMLNCVLGNV
jgi:hypothetical protein